MQASLSGKEHEMDQAFSVSEYVNRSIRNIASGALRASLSNPKETAFIMKFSQASRRAAKVRASYEDSGRHIPAFLIASISSRCNLFCKGCYARANRTCTEAPAPDLMPASAWNDIFSQARDIGISFILLAGGEPLLRKEVIEYASLYPEILFPVFTNGTMITDDYLNLFDRFRNIVPILSIEGSRRQTDERRGAGVYDKIAEAMQKLHSRHILYGVSITVTTETLVSVTAPSFVGSLAGIGCSVVFYVEYVPVTPVSGHLAPGEPERAYLEKQLDSLRSSYPETLFLSFPGDEKYTGGCLAAGRGFFHINPEGGAEPCPFSPYSDMNVRGRSLLEVLDSGLFQKLRASGLLAGEHKGGCLLFEKEEDVKGMLER